MTKPEFFSWRSYQDFARLVRHTCRYVWHIEVQAFLDTVLATLKDRDMKLARGKVLYRAPRGINYDPTVDDDGNDLGEAPWGFDANRMKPLTDRAREGRVNPTGIPVLYLASEIHTAISEVRPWVGSDISVAQFKILRDIKAINLSAGHDQDAAGHLTLDQLTDAETPDAASKEKSVWIDIDNAFSRPVTFSDDATDYVPTQILAELFRNAGYQAIIYRSQFGKRGYNIALFNAEDAEVISCTPFRVTCIGVNYEPMGNTWHSRKHAKAEKMRPD
jgi:hypothetical protein